MRSRAARSLVVAFAFAAIVASAAFLYRSEQQVASSTTALRSFDLHAREAADALADLRSAQQAYVAAGQGVTFWMPKVTSISDGVTSAIRALRQSAASVDARAALDRAAAALAEFGDIDTRARDYMKSGEQLMAADVIFTEGTSTTGNAAREVEAARLAEHQDFDQSTSDHRRQEAIGAAAAAGVGLLGLLLLVPLPAVEHVDVAPVAAKKLEDLDEGARLIPNPPGPAPAPQPAPHPPSRSAGPLMKSAADLATDISRARDAAEIERLVGRMAELIDASGVVVWVGDAAGGDLRPALTYGYSPQVVSRMPSVARNGNNAAAAAYRTASMQIVLSRPGGANGAVVAPILTADGCIGAVSAEIRSGGETSDTVQALAVIFAAQLANVIAVPAAAETPAKTASA
jgi:hypothetical protein